MPLYIACPQCSHAFNVPDHAAGRKVLCPKCQTALNVPGSAADGAALVFDELEPAPAPSPRRSASPPRGNWFVDFLVFRRMASPIAIQLFFWLAVLLCIISGVATIVRGARDFDKRTAAASKLQGAERKEAEDDARDKFLGYLVLGMAQIFAGPALARFVAEYFILIFRINETLTDIRNNTLR
jgi:predicted Zn finger-like uncharacterized protein